MVGSLRVWLSICACRIGTECGPSQNVQKHRLKSRGRVLSLARVMQIQY